MATAQQSLTCNAPLLPVQCVAGRLLCMMNIGMAAAQRLTHAKQHRLLCSGVRVAFVQEPTTAAVLEAWSCSCQSGTHSFKQLALTAGLAQSQSVCSGRPRLHHGPSRLSHQTAVLYLQDGQDATFSGHCSCRAHSAETAALTPLPGAGCKAATASEGMKQQSEP